MSRNIGFLRRPRERPVFAVAAATVLLTATISAGQPSSLQASFTNGDATSRSKLAADLLIKRTLGVSEGSFLFCGEPGEDRIVVGPVTLTGTPPRGALDYSPDWGLRIRLDASQLRGRGYGPIQIEIAANRPVVRKLVVSVHLTAYHGRRGQPLTTIGSATLPRGGRSTKFRMFVPQYFPWNSWGWRTYVDGQFDRALSVADLNWPSPGVQACPVVLATPRRDAPPDYWEQLLATAGGSKGTPHYETRPLAMWPDDWLSWTGYDLALLRAREFAGLAKEHPVQFLALRRWIAAGGTVGLLESGTDWSELPAIDAALEDFGGSLNDDSQRGEPARTGQTSAARWHPLPLAGQQAEPGPFSLLLSGQQIESTRKLQATMREAWSSTLAGNASSANDVRVRGEGFGVVAAFQSPANSRPGWTLETAERLAQSALAPRLNWEERHGNSPQQENYHFNNWLIPGVGSAPVGMFQFLITLFVAVIGPLNYWYFSRRRQLPLILATTPAISAAALLAMMAYAFATDGWGTRSRIRSVTFLDQVRGEAAAWTRATYYAGLSPEEGLTAGLATAVYPIEPGWSPRIRRFGESRRRTVAWADLQHFDQAWLPSRTPTQFLSIRAAESRARLQIRSQKTELEIANRLGTAVRLAVIEDGDGRHFWMENLAVDERRTLTPARPEDFAIHLRRMFATSFPEFPVGGDPANYHRRRYDFGPLLSRNPMEAAIEAFNSPNVRSWGPRTYLALTERAVDDAPLAKGASQEAGFHLLRGRW